MEALIGYVILFIGFCVIPLVVVGVIVYFIYRARKNKGTTPQPQPVRQQPTAAVPDPNAQVPANQAATAVADQTGLKPVKPSVRIVSSGKNATPLYLTLASKPRAILDGMDRLVTQTQVSNLSGQRWKLLPRIGFFLGLGMIVIDLLLRVFGYSSCVFTTGGLAVWVASFVLSRILKRQKLAEFPEGFQTGREIVYTLRDDLKPGAPLLGHLDLTGYKHKDKVARETKDTRDRTTQYYRDEWLSLKAKLYDGNVLRVSAIQRAKIRQSYWKRSQISGKMKMKPEKFKGSDQQLKVRIVVNPEMYEIASNSELSPGKSVGKYTITALDTQGGILNLLATSSFDQIEAEHILSVLHSAYSVLQRKAA